MLLQSLFPKRARARSVVHAGALIAGAENGPRALRRYLRFPREREVFLLHNGQEMLSEAAEDAGVTDISLSEPHARAEAMAAAEMAVALGAGRLDFAIDDPCVTDPNGTPLQELTVEEAESLARRTTLGVRLRAKLRAGCEALRSGLTRVRIGNPAALLRDQATVLVRDPAVPVRITNSWVMPDGEGARQVAFAASPAPSGSVVARAVAGDPGHGGARAGASPREPWGPRRVAC